MRLFSLCFLMGTLIIQSLDNIPSCSIVFVVFSVSFVISLFSFKFLKYKTPYLNLVLSSVCAALLGLFLSSYQAEKLLHHRIAPNLEGKELLISGSIRGIPSIRDDGVRFIFDVTEAKVVDEPDQSINLKGFVKLGWYQQVQAINAGEFWQLKVKLKRPSGFMNP